MSMPKRIKILPETVVSQIAAGEVIENPVGVLKELIENSIDAKSTSIDICVQNAGFDLIQVHDNGIGIHKDDLLLAIQSFSTSKVRTIDDVYSTFSLGFRGEALSSIASVSNFQLDSKYSQSDKAYYVQQKSGTTPSKVKISSLPVGSKIQVKNLFLNIPVRKEFNKNLKKIKKDIFDLILKFCHAHFNISFSLTYEKKVEFIFKKKISLKERIMDIYSVSFFESLMPVYWEIADKQMKIEGYISNFSFYKNNPSMIFLFLNRRAIHYQKL